MISKLLVLGAYSVAAVSILVGIFVFSTIPRDLGFYRWLTTLNVELVGLTPAFHHGIPWKYTWEEFYAQDFSGQTAIVTGANSGIGFDISVALAKVGAAVTMVCRNPRKCEMARSKLIQRAGISVKVETMTMDTSSLASVQAFVKSYQVEHGKNQPVDMLFLNAGLAYLPAPGESVECSKKTEADGIEYLFQVNYLSHHLLYRLLEPHLSKSKRVRIVQTASSASFHTYSYKVATNLETLHGCSEPFMHYIQNLSYGQSKLAQILWVKALTRKLASSNNRVFANAFHPGIVDTPNIDKVLENAGDQMRQFTAEFILPSAWKSPDGALTGLYLAVNPEGVRGQLYHPQSQQVTHPLALDEQLQDDLWAFSDELVKNYLPETATSDEKEPIVEDPPLDVTSAAAEAQA